MKAAKLAFTLGLLAFTFPAQANDRNAVRMRGKSSRVSPQVENGLEISLSHDYHGTGTNKAMQFLVTFQSLKDTIRFMPGTLVNCGTSPSQTSWVRVNLIDSEGRQYCNLRYLGDGPPYMGICGGEVAPFVVVLPRGASTSLRLDLGKYLDLSDSKKYDYSARLHAGTYLLQAEFTGVAQPPWPAVPPTGKRTAPSRWLGKVESNTIQVHFDHEFALLLANYPD